MDPDHPDSAALKNPQSVYQPLTCPDHVVGDDVHSVVQVCPDGAVAGMHGQVQDGARVHGEPLQPVGLDRAVPCVVLGPHPRKVKLLWRQRKPEQIYPNVHPTLGGKILKRQGERRLSRAGSAVEEDEFALWHTRHSRKTISHPPGPGRVYHSAPVRCAAAVVHRAASAFANCAVLHTHTGNSLAHAAVESGR
ncbi:Uncharacterised protein [Mycobacterium tuberculosis]|uniref:Uncharacterized protein n=1 Tax=Mycobacterium tuberculosis TaxID=1773 RepID=A0A655AFW1_MYCTX|nr:Uncharacterised protein [Mycobacterium tuberculosis]CKS75800.1 Uncharacterised protein [Mycobacterium tuberculosis]CKT11855.1 Uncharacterised protein [Mycobacterium tuberculosis]CKV24532.1 Uncharacterised protein [Mycobacterium tuberculosis]CKW35084.1 Uncharacterised protein [Mycobacterium tuberculosis]